jgi:hypothetical protein
MSSPLLVQKDYFILPDRIVVLRLLIFPCPVYTKSNIIRPISGLKFSLKTGDLLDPTIRARQAQ